MGTNLVEYSVYHGTNVERGNRFLKNNKFEVSLGDKHWLGNGCYFYEQLFYSYKWIADMFKTRESKCHSTYDELVSKYKILRCKISVQKDRIFNLDNYEEKYIFEKLGILLAKKSKYSSRFSKNDIVDGVIINILFNEFKYTEKYDLIMASFARRQNKYKNNSHTRLNFILEKQICVKNTNIIVSIEDEDFKKEYTNVNYIASILNEENNMNSYIEKGKRYSKRNIYN